MSLYRAQQRILPPQTSFQFPVATDVYFDSAKLMTLWGSSGAGGRGVTLASWIRITDGTHPGGSASHYLGCQQTSGGLGIRRSTGAGTPLMFWTHVTGSSGSDVVKSVAGAGQVDRWQLVIARLLQRTTAEIWVGNESAPPVDVSDSTTLTTATGDWNAFSGSAGPYAGGFNTAGAYSLGGDLAYARIFNRYLSASQIRQLWQDWFAWDGDNSIEVDWHFSGATTANDRSGNGFHATLGGASASSGLAGIEGPRLPSPNRFIFVFPSTTKQGSSTLSGTGTLAGAAIKTAVGASSLSGTGDLSGAAIKTAVGASALTGTGDLAATGRLRGAGSAALVGIGTLAAVAHKTGTGAAAMTGTGTLAATETGTSGTGGGGGQSNPMKYTGATE